METELMDLQKLTFFTEGNTFTAELVLPLSKRYNSER